MTGEKTARRVLGIAILLAIAAYLLLIVQQPLLQIVVLFGIAFFGSALTSRLSRVFRSSWNTGRIARLRKSELITKIRTWFPTSQLAFFLVFAVEVYLAALAYAVTLAYPGNGTIVYNIVSVLVTIEGLLLGLLSLSVFTVQRIDRRIPYLAILTIFSVFFSLATIMLAELSAQLVSWALPAFFMIDVFLFVLVGALYSWFLVGWDATRRHQG